MLRFVKDTCYVTGGVSFVGAGTTVLGPHTAVATGSCPTMLKGHDNETSKLEMDAFSCRLGIV